MTGRNFFKGVFLADVAILIFIRFEYRNQTVTRIYFEFAAVFSSIEDLETEPFNACCYRYIEFP